MRYIFFIITLFISFFNLSAQISSRDIAVSRAKEVFVATANGDVAKLKQLTTQDFYKENYPYSDSRVREILLSVPAEKRKRMINQIQNQCTATTRTNRTGDVITVTLTNKVTKKIFTVQLIKDNKDNWKIFNYWY